MAGAGKTSIARQLATALAMLALAFQFAIPSGFMVARGADGPAIVICTGHGPLLAHHGERGQPGKSPSSNSGGVCAFAGHGGAPVAPPVLSLIGARFEALAVLPAARPDLAPGRGLAAPPPPSQGPPASLI